MKLISNFDQLTKQDMFDMALAHVRKNGKQSMRDGVCCYTGTGIGCAASVFIDPESLAKLPSFFSVRAGAAPSLPNRFWMLTRP